MHSPQKGFQLQTDSHIILTTYQPSHIDFTVTDRSNGHVQKGHFYDSTLPASVKEQCEAVSDLYDFLEGKLPSEMQVDGNSLKFKVVRIKKERWYSLGIQEEAGSEPLQREQGLEPTSQKMEEEVDNLGLLTERNEDLQHQNEQLKREVERLNTINAEMQKRLESNDLQVLIRSGLMEVDSAMELEKAQHVQNNPIIQQENHSIPLPIIRSPTLTRTAHQNIHYKVQNGTITKQTSQSSVLCFQESIQRGQKASFSIQVLSSLNNNWIIFGVLPKELQNNPLCYFNQGCIAYSGSMSLIFNDKDTFDMKLERKVSEGDRLCLQLDFTKKSVRWLINNKQECHPMGGAVLQKELYPFLMLAQPGDSVRVDCDE